MSSTNPNPLQHKEKNVLLQEVVEEAFWILVEEDSRWEKQCQMKQQLSTQRWKSQKLHKISKKILLEWWWSRV